MPKTGSPTIPEIREELHEMSTRLRQLAEAMHRRKPVRRVARSSPPMTPQLARRIRVFAELNPTMPASQIAARFKVNPGRVSEALRGEK